MSRARRECIEFPHKASGYQAKGTVCKSGKHCSPLLHKNIQSIFISCLETGFQDDNIASKMRSVLKDKNIADEDLIEKLNEVVDAENERQTKLQGFPGLLMRDS